MIPSTGPERARYEQLLARAHQAIWQLHVMCSGFDEYDEADGFFCTADHLGELMDASLKKGGRLRTAPRHRA